MDYQKAFTVRAPIRGVYAHQCDETRHIQLYDDLLFFKEGEWLVWHPGVITYEIVSDEEFRNLYVLETELPPHMSHHAKNMPSYDAWLALCNMGMEPAQ